jgi:hypothetical protein
LRDRTASLLSWNTAKRPFTIRSSVISAIIPGDLPDWVDRTVRLLFVSSYWGDSDFESDHAPD